MLPTILLTAALAALTTAQTPGYCSKAFTTLPNNNTFNFGRHYAVLNLDLVEFLVAPLNNTAAGKTFINSTATWINAVHAQKPPPISLFTRIYVANAMAPEIGGPFAAALGGGPAPLASDPGSAVYHSFVPKPNYDVVLQKARYYGGAGNELELILSSQKIDTVIISGIRTSGVVLATISHLFDLNYFVYVIADNVIESPSPSGVADAQTIDCALKQGVFPKLPANVITLQQALAALKRSGPAVY